MAYFTILLGISILTFRNHLLHLFGPDYKSWENILIILVIGQIFYGLFGINTHAQVRECATVAVEA